jgi:molybdate transport system substrate-binding protein
VLAVPGVPVRDYTDATLVSLADDPNYGSTFAEAFYANLASEEANVRQVAAKVALGEADAGIVYASDVTPEIADKVQQISIPTAHTQSVNYPIARLTGRATATQAEAFIDYVLSDEGQAILQRWGFGPRIE